MSKPTVVLMAAGSNSRFFPLNRHIHKAQLPLLGKPLIVHTLHQLADLDLTEVVIIVNPGETGDSLQRELDSLSLPLTIRYAVQDQATGMGDALLAAADLLSESFLVTNPYYMNAVQYFRLLLDHPGKKVILSNYTNRPWDYGVLKLEGDTAKGIIEKPAKGTEPSNWKNLVIHKLDQDYLETLKQTPKDEYSYELALDQIMATSQVDVIKIEEQLVTLKYPWHLLAVKEYLFNSLKSHRGSNISVANTAIIDESHGPVYVDDGAKIGHSARVVGPCYIGKNALVGDFSLVRESSLEQDSVVGANTEVARSVILPQASIHYSYLADSILGIGAKIGAGLITANKRFDRQPVETFIKNKRVNSDLKAFGTVVGHAANLGVGIRTMPGTLIGSGAIVYPATIIYKNVEHDQTISAE